MVYVFFTVNGLGMPLFVSGLPLFSWSAVTHFAGVYGRPSWMIVVGSILMTILDARLGVRSDVKPEKTEAEAHRQRE